MKTKVAEALMFGKNVIGTGEAFSGYASEVVTAGWLAEDAPCFLAAIRDAAEGDLPDFDSAARALYDCHHSVAAATRRMAHIMRQRPGPPMTRPGAPEGHDKSPDPDTAILARFPS